MRDDFAILESYVQQCLNRAKVSTVTNDKVSAQELNDAVEQLGNAFQAILNCLKHGQE